MPAERKLVGCLVVVIEVGDATTGLVVDAVSDVADIPAEQIEPRTAARAGDCVPQAGR